MNTTPKISIIASVCNSKAVLSKMLDSVLNQSLRDLELICVDNGSSDGSLDLLSSYADRDSRVRVIPCKSLTSGGVWNAGLDAASGEFVHFLNAGDYVLDYAYEALYNKAVKYELDCLKCCSVAYDPVLGSAVEIPEFTLEELRPGDFHRLLTPEPEGVLFSVTDRAWSGIYRRAFLTGNQISFPELEQAADSVFYHRVIAASRVMACRDTLVVHELGKKDTELEACRRELEDRRQAISLTEPLLEAQGADREMRLLLFGEAMRQFFACCDGWRRTFADRPEEAELLRQEVQRCAEAYEGPYGYPYGDRFVRYLHAMSFGIKAEEQPEPAAFWHEACKKPKVSVVIPTYNVEDYLNEALHSLSVQTLEEMEFLCVNDGSTDGSLTILREYAARDKRFRILDGPNGGYGKAMNRGIDAARGEYLGILEPDDFVRKDMFRRLSALADKRQVDFVKADFYRFMINPDGSMRRTRNRLSGDDSFYGRPINPGEEQTVFKFVMNTWSGIYRLSFLNRWHIRHNETPGASYQDNGFWFQTFCRATKAWFVKKPYYMNRRDNPNSSMFSKKKLYCITDEYRYIWDWMSKEPELVEKFSSIYHLKKLGNYLVTLHRVSEEYRQEYLHHICDEFRPAVEQGILTEELVGDTDWYNLNQILEDPDAYYEKIRVSVIIPVYNAEAYLRQCLDSVVARSEMKIEVICVDDGSSDGSLDILREYEAKYPRFKVLTQANAGAGAARNYGMKYARGEYLSFLDADDFFEPMMLRRAYERACVMDADIVAFRSDQYIAATETFLPAAYTINARILPPTQPFAGEDVPRDIFKLFVGWAWDKLFRADFVRENGLLFQEQRTSNDMLFVFSSIVRAKRITTMNNVFAHHRRDAGSLSVTREKSWPCFYNALVALRQQLKDWGVYERFERDFINYSQHFTLWNLTSLRGPSFYALYEKLRSEWLQDLGILDHDELYFYNNSEYCKLRSVMELSPEEFLFRELDEARTERNDLRLEVRELTNQNENLDAAKQSLTLSSQKLRESNQELRLSVRELRGENKKLRNQLKKMRKSLPWKLGRILTWLPRKIKGMLKS